MEQIWNWGIAVIEGMQKATCKPLDYLAFFIHYGCNTPIYLAIVMLFFWCINYKKGYILGFLIVFTAGLNTIVKGFIKAPRPYQFTSSSYSPETYKPGITSGPDGSSIYSDSPVFRIEEGGYSTPSGHAQGAATAFPVVAKFTNWKKVWKILFAILIPVIIAVSRNYLGVHYPTDVIGGLLLGFLVVLCFFVWGAKIDSILKKLRKSIRLLLTALLCVVMIVLDPNDSSMPGALFGCVCGYLMMDSGKKFDASKGFWWQKLFRFILGATMVAVVYLGLKKLFPSSHDNQWYQLCRFVRYGFSGFTIAGLAPWIFVKLHLGEKENE